MDPVLKTTQQVNNADYHRFRCLLCRRESEIGKVDSTVCQLLPFDMPEHDVEPEPKKVEVPAHTRKKAGRKQLPAPLPQVEVIHNIPEEEKPCTYGFTLTRIGKEVSKNLDYVPATIQAIRHIRPKYSCKGCEGLNGEGTMLLRARAEGMNIHLNRCACCVRKRSGRS